MAIMFVVTIPATRTAQAQLYSFTGAPNGAQPWAGLVRDEQGNLYGTTAGGGINGGLGGGTAGLGTVFKLDTTTGEETVLYAFTGGGDGGVPEAALVRDARGNLYGTTQYGGASENGTVFKVDRSGQETVLHSFTGGADGAYPEGVLVLDAQGNVYGTASGGGASGSGTVFKVDATGNETTLYSFTGTPDGASPYAGLVLDEQGNLYGTTLGGGASGRGTMFKVDTTGNETVLYSSTGAGDGGSPYAGLVRDRKGNLYGTTFQGGNPACHSYRAGYGCGTVFKVDTTGKETVLYSFTGSGGDGAYPYAGLARDWLGNLYGTTFVGGDLQCGFYGPFGCGTVFKLDSTGKETVLLTFGGMGFNGANPAAGLVWDAQNNLYGTTYLGGENDLCYPVGCGTVFQISVAATTLSSSQNPSTYGGPVNFTATVTSLAGTPPDGETVTFMKDTTVLGTTTLSGGSASFVTGSLPAGASWIKAVYGGDSYFLDSASKWLKQAVGKAPTTTALSSSQNPSNFGQLVTFVATVLASVGSPTGSVTFNNGTTAPATVPLSSGTAWYTTIKLAVGTEPITAVYNGNSSFTTSTSNVLSQTVNQANTATTLVSSLNPSNVGQSVTFTASVTPQFAFEPTGPVTFYDGTTKMGAGYLSEDAAKFTTSRLTSGTHSITATYNGNAEFDSSSSAPLTQTVN